jgi:hypothetical protein
MPACVPWASDRAGRRSMGRTTRTSQRQCRWIYRSAGGARDCGRSAGGELGGDAHSGAERRQPVPRQVLRSSPSGTRPAVFDRRISSRRATSPGRVQSFALLRGRRRRARGLSKPADADARSRRADARDMNCWRLTAASSACRDVEPSPRGEFELPLAVGLALRRGVQFRAVPARGPVLDLSRRADTAEVARRLRGAHLAP